MNSEDVFLTGMIVLVMVNIFIWGTSIENFSFNNVAFSIISGELVIALTVGVIGGLNILGTGLNSSSTKIIFAVASLMNIMFSIKIGGTGSSFAPPEAGYRPGGVFSIDGNGFQFGLGLATNVINLFSNSANDFYGLGYMISWLFALVVFASGLIIIIRSSS